MTFISFVTALGGALMGLARRACIERCELIGGGGVPVLPENAA